MRMLWYSRRTFIASLAILILGVFGYLKGIDVSMSIASIAIAFAGANAYEGAQAPKATPPVVKAAEKPAVPEDP